MAQTNQEWIWVEAALWWYKLLPGKVVDATPSPNSLLLLPSLVQLQKCGSPAHTSQVKLKSLEGRKEVRQTYAHSPSCGEAGLLGSETCRGDGMQGSVSGSVTAVVPWLVAACSMPSCRQLAHWKPGLEGFHPSRCVQLFYLQADRLAVTESRGKLAPWSSANSLSGWQWDKRLVHPKTKCCVCPSLLTTSCLVPCFGKRCGKWTPVGSPRRGRTAHQPFLAWHSVSQAFNCSNSLLQESCRRMRAHLLSKDSSSL